MLLSLFAESGVKIHPIGTEVNREHVISEMPFPVFAKELHAKVSKANLLAHRKPIPHAIPKLQNIYGKVGSVFFPYISMDGKFVVQSAVVRKERLNPKYLTPQRL